jgi:hypothetical protein
VVYFIRGAMKKMAHYHSYPQATERNPLGIHTHRFCILFRPAVRLCFFTLCSHKKSSTTLKKYVFTRVRNRTQDQNWLPRLTSSSYLSPVKCFVCTGTFKQVMLNFLHIHFHSPYHTIYFSVLCDINSWNNATSNKRHEVNQNVWYSLLFLLKHEAQYL